MTEWIKTIDELPLNRQTVFVVEQINGRPYIDRENARDTLHGTASTKQGGI